MAGYLDFLNNLFPEDSPEEQARKAALEEEVTAKMAARASEIPAAQFVNKGEEGLITPQGVIEPKAAESNFDYMQGQGPLAPEFANDPKPIFDIINRPTDKTVDFSSILEASKPKQTEKVSTPTPTTPDKEAESPQQSSAKDPLEDQYEKEYAEGLEAADSMEDKKQKPSIEKTVTPLEAAQQRRDELQAALLMLKGGTQIGTALASRGRTQLEKGYLDDAMKMADREVTKLQEQQEKRFNDIKENILLVQQADAEQSADPNSEASKMYRSLVGQLASSAGIKINIPENLSVNQLKGSLGTLNNLASAKVAGDQRAELAAEKKLEREAAKLQKESDKRFDQEKTLRKEIDTVNDKIKYTEVKTALKGIKDFYSNPNAAKGIGDIMSLYTFIKSIDPGSVVREGEIALTQQGESMLGKVTNYGNRITRGDIFSDKFRRGILGVLENMTMQREKQFLNEIGPRLKAAKQYGLDPENIINTQVGDLVTKADSKPEAKLSDNEKIMRDTKSGRNVVVDKNTNQVLRWAE